MHIDKTGTVSLEGYVQTAVSGGIPREQALIRRWWHENQNAIGLLVWEYYLGDGNYADAIWFPDEEKFLGERPEQKVSKVFPIAGRKVILCESKLTLSHGLIGQALVYRALALRAGAEVLEVITFSEIASPTMIQIARDLGLKVVASQPSNLQYESNR